MSHRGQHHAQVHRHRLGQRASRQLDHRLHIGLAISHPPRIGVPQSTAILPDDKGIGHALQHLL